MESSIIAVSDISQSLSTSMLGLMQKYYRNVDHSRFKADLVHKDMAILLRTEGKLRGFSTLVLYKFEFEGQDNLVVFSGDTIIDAQYRNSLALPITFGRYLLSIHEQNTEKPLYWLLTSKGYKTYRFLSVFFNKYYPNPHGNPLAAEKRLFEKFCRQIFREKFDRKNWILTAGPDSQVLNDVDSEIDECRRKNPDIAFFEKQNPGYGRGDELVCFTRFDKGNIKPYILKQLLQ